MTICKMLMLAASILLSVTVAQANTCTPVTSTTAPVSEATPGYQMVYVHLPVPLARGARAPAHNAGFYFRFFIAGHFDTVVPDTYTSIDKIEKCTRVVTVANGMQYDDPLTALRVKSNVSEHYGAQAFAVISALVLPKVLVDSKPFVFTRLSNGQLYIGTWTVRDGQQNLVLSHRELGLTK